MTDDLLLVTTKKCYLYTEKVMVHRMSGERFRYVAACSQRLRCWGAVTLVARAGILGTRWRKAKGSVVREKRNIVGQYYGFS